MNKVKRPGMAPWLKITIAVLIVGFISLIGLLVAAGMFVVDHTKKALDPKYSAQVANSIIKLEEPLPQGFIRMMAFDLGMGMKQVHYSNPSEGLSIIIMKLDSKGGTADSIVGNYASSGTSSLPADAAYDIGSAGGLPLIIVGKGRLTVAGESMPYVIGDRSVNGTKVPQFVGCVVPKDSRTPIVILGQNNLPGGAYKLALTKKVSPGRARLLIRSEWLPPLTMPGAEDICNRLA